MKPIEAGCLAVLISSKYGNEGKTVKVIKYVGETITNRFEFAKNAWHVEPLFDCGIIGNVLAEENQLMRIDGFNPDAIHYTKELVI